MDGQSLVLFAFAVFLGASTHRLTGMGFSLVSSPLLVIAVGPHDAVAVLQIFGVLMSVFMLVHVWRDVDWGVLWWLTIPALVGIIPGVLVARRLSVPTLEVLVGLLVVVALSITAIAPRCRVFKGRAGASAVGAMSGFMNATASLSGHRSRSTGSRQLGITSPSLPPCRCISSWSAGRRLRRGACPAWRRQRGGSASWPCSPGSGSAHCWWVDCRSPGLEPWSTSWRWPGGW